MSYETLCIEARKQFEAGEIDRPLLRQLYGAYNPDVEIDTFLDAAKPMFPALNCGIASVYLSYLIGVGVVHNGTYGNIGHTFLRVEDIVLDITADQFGGPAVYVGVLKNPWSLDAPTIHEPLYSTAELPSTIL